MKVLVTGASGFLGSALVARLLAHGEEDLRLFVRAGSHCDRLEALTRKYPRVAIELFVGNLDQLADVPRALVGVDLVYHLVAASRGTATEISQTTVVTSRNLLDAIVALPIDSRPRVVLVSSFSVYGVAALPRGALIDETAPLESHPDRRDLYAKAKLRQEKLFWEYRSKHGLQLVVVRPGVIYGPGGVPVPNRVGLSVSGVFLLLGGNNLLPLTYVDNCGEALAVVGRLGLEGEVYNAVDDDLPTCRAYLRQYQKQVKKLRVVHLPYPVTRWLSIGMDRLKKLSDGRLPALLTAYQAATTWGGNRFSNEKVKALGYRPVISTPEGLTLTFASLSR